MEAKSNFKYIKREDGTLEIIGWAVPQETLELPAEIDGCRVTAISSSAFSNDQTIQKIILPEGLEIMGSSVFYGCKNVQYIVLPNSLREFKDSLNTFMPNKPVVPVVRSYSVPAACKVVKMRYELFYWDKPLNAEFENEIQNKLKAAKRKSKLSMLFGALFFIFGIIMLVGLSAKIALLMWGGIVLMFASLGMVFYIGNK